MVIPWAGYSLSKLLEVVRPTSDARYVAFQTLLDPKRMPGQKTRALAWPYVEGLRLDEARHPLALLATGIYGRELPPQDGAPVRLVLPWKYGFKGIKSIVKITLTASMPPSTWNLQAPSEYGFYANVNPNVDHPRWSQATERRIGEGRRKTLPFNGYAEQVARQSPAAQPQTLPGAAQSLKFSATAARKQTAPAGCQLAAAVVGGVCAGRGSSRFCRRG